jgi:hypothetical protein
VNLKSVIGGLRQEAFAHPGGNAGLGARSVQDLRNHPVADEVRVVQETAARIAFEQMLIQSVGLDRGELPGGSKYA